MATNNAANANSTTPLTIVNGGTGVNAVPTSASASAYVGWDSNKNIPANSFASAIASTATAAGTTTLTVSSSQIQVFTGSTTQTVKLPVTSTLATGFQFVIINQSSGALTINASDSSLIGTLSQYSSMTLTCISTGVTSNAAWLMRFQVEYPGNIIPTATSLLWFDTNGSLKPTASFSTNQFAINTGGVIGPGSVGAGLGIVSSSLVLSGSSGAINQNTSSVTMSINTKYIINNGASLVTLTLPSVAAVGDFFQIRGQSSGQWKIGQGSGQTIHLSGVSTTTGTGGSIASTNQYDTVQIECIITNTDFVICDAYTAGFMVV